ncbi:MAG: FAD-dependent oxidoreductase [Hymenobacter sp.]
MDVALIGGGYAGLAAALDLTGRGHRVAVVERKCSTHSTRCVANT